ncbi:hypothetical protein AGMMS49940_02100 [Spirochaetia bacterium]|nr:hypothetical protein AGMMS49940_02100 [Spirochaetia bacterium]
MIDCFPNMASIFFDFGIQTSTNAQNNTDKGIDNILRASPYIWPIPKFLYAVLLHNVLVMPLICANPNSDIQNKYIIIPAIIVITIIIILYGTYFLFLCYYLFFIMSSVFYIFLRLGHCA